MSMYGNTNARRKLDRGDVDNIRTLWAEKKRLMEEAKKITLRGLAEKFDVSQAAIEKVVYEDTWNLPQ